MKFAPLILALALLLGGCGKKPSEQATPNPDASAPAAPARKTNPIRLTERLTSMLGRVMITSPTGEISTVSAAMLHRDDSL